MPSVRNGYPTYTTAPFHANLAKRRAMFDATSPPHSDRFLHFLDYVEQLQDYCSGVTDSATGAFTPNSRWSDYFAKALDNGWFCFETWLGINGLRFKHKPLVGPFETIDPLAYLRSWTDNTLVDAEGYAISHAEAERLYCFWDFTAQELIPEGVTVVFNAYKLLQPATPEPLVFLDWLARNIHGSTYLSSLTFDNFAYKLHNRQPEHWLAIFLTEFNAQLHHPKPTLKQCLVWDFDVAAARTSGSLITVRKPQEQS